MKAPTVQEVKEYFVKVGKDQGKLWLPTKTRNEIIAEEGFASRQTIIVKGRVYKFHFKNIGGGMWETTLKDLSE